MNGQIWSLPIYTPGMTSSDQRSRAGRLSAVAIALLLMAAGCGGSDVPAAGTSAADRADDPVGANDEASAPGIRLVEVEEAAAILAAPPDELIVLDVRTPEEFDGERIEGAIMVDFYDDDFADQLAELDPDVPYLLYCRSGNRSGQTREVLAELGFTDVADVDGGIVAWVDAGLPVVIP